MASETEELAKQMAAMAESLKSIGQYSKDLAAAIGAANRPMQQLSDYSKAIGESMKGISKSMEEQKAAVAALNTAMGEASKKISENNQGESESQRVLNEKKIQTEELRAANVALQIQRSEMWAAETAAGKKRNEELREEKKHLEEAQGLWQKLHRKVKETQADWGKKDPGSASAANTFSEMMTGKDMSGGFGSITQSISGLLPTAGGIGGLIGMILYGKTREAEFNAIGEQAAQFFDQVGGHTEAFAGRIGGLSKNLSAHGILAKDDLTKVAHAMAETGMTAKQAQTQISGFTSVAGKDFMAMSISMDKAFELGAGSAAKMGGILQRDFNMTTKDAANNLMLMAQAAKESGGNVATFMQQTMEAASSLRLLNAHQADFINLQSGVAKAYQRGGLNAQFSQAYSSAGSANLGQQIGGGMNEGVRAILAQRMYGGNALDALSMLESPVARAGHGSGANRDELDVNRFIKEMSALMDSSGVQGVGATRKFAKGVFGTDEAGTDAFLKAREAMSRGEAVDPSTMKAIAEGLKHESQKKSVMERIVDEIKNIVGDIMTGLLSMIVNELKLIYNGVMALYHTISSSPLFGGSPAEIDRHKNLAGQYESNAMSAMTGVGVGVQRMVDAASKDSTGTAKEILGAFGLSGGWSVTDPKTNSERLNEANVGTVMQEKLGEALDGASGNSPGPIMNAIAYHQRAAAELSKQMAKALGLSNDKPYHGKKNK